MSVFVWLITGIVTLLGAILVATIAHILSEDAKSFIPRFCERLIAKAAKRIEGQDAADLKEEWLSHLLETPELSGKLRHAVTLYLWGAARIAKTAENSRSERDVLGLGWRYATFVVTKRGFDVLVACALLPVILTTAFALLIFNPWLNKGPLFFVQKRMGQGCRPFNAIKFRTITECTPPTRSAKCPLEVERITPFGRFLRQTRIDELPQAINVLQGEMSLIGPRSDCHEHAEYYLRSVPGYRNRHLVRPGISGLAQTEIGYTAGSDGTSRKVQADLFYVANAGFRMDLWILWRTMATVFGRK